MSQAFYYMHTFNAQLHILEFFLFNLFIFKVLNYI